MKKTVKRHPVMGIKQRDKFLAKAIQKDAEKKGITPEEAAEQAVREIADQMEPQINFKNEKMKGIVDRVLESLSDIEKAKYLSEDTELKNLYVDLAKAKKDNKALVASITQRLIDHRGKEALVKLAEKKINEYVVSGHILYFMEKEDADTFNRARMQVLLMMDLLDSSLVDLKGAIHKAGMSGEVTMLPAIEEARKHIQMWTDNVTKKKDEQSKELIKDECDYINTFIHEKRVPVLDRKLAKHLEKLKKEAEVLNE